MPIDQATAAFLDFLRSSGGKPLHETPVAEARANMAAGAQLGAPPAEVERVDDLSIEVSGGRINLRIYTPHGAEKGVGLPAVLQYHGGGFVLGDLDSHDSIARYYCAHARAVVVSVDYRRAPEHRFPTAMDDAWAALLWVCSHAGELGVNADRVGVTGDSAGGNLAAAMCWLARAHGGPRVACQALVYPVTDFREGAVYPSHEEFGDGDYFISTKDMDWFRTQYFGDPAVGTDDPRASPMAEPNLAGLPPALVVTAGCDPLRDEGRAYADRLAAAGVPVEYRCFETTIHACASFAGAIPAGLELLAFVAGWLRAELHDSH